MKGGGGLKTRGTQRGAYPPRSGGSIGAYVFGHFDPLQCLDPSWLVKRFYDACVYAGVRFGVGVCVVPPTFVANVSVFVFASVSAFGDVFAVRVFLLWSIYCVFWDCSILQFGNYNLAKCALSGYFLA